MNKKELREKYRLIRKNIKNKEYLDNIIVNKVLNNKNILKSDIVLIYVSNNEEIDTLNIINHLLKTKKVAVPKIEDGVMNFYFIKSLDDLEKGYFNILEPTTKEKVLNFDNSVCITPGVCYSWSKYRIGYGKGFYDKFFSKNKVYKIGLCYKKCYIKEEFNDKYDIKVDEVITD